MAAFSSKKASTKDSLPHVLTLVLLAAAAAIPMNIFVASLPAMANYFETGYGVIQLSITGYLFLTGFTQLIAGPLSDRFGRRPVVLGSLALFIIASLGCALAPNIETFLLFRGAQAVIAAGMILSRTIARDMVGPEHAASLIGYVTMGMALAPMIAPPLGGVLQDLFGWQSNFYVMALAATVVGGIAWFDLGETNKQVTASVAAQWKMYPGLLASRRFWGYSLTAAFSAGAFFAFLSGAPLVGTHSFGLSPTALGLFFAITPLGYMIGNGLSGRFATRLGINRMMLIGSSISGVMLGLALVLQLAGAQHPLSFFGFTFFIGLGNGIVLPASNVGMMSVKPELAGSASGLGGALMTFFGSGLSALTVAILVRAPGATSLILCLLGTLLAALLVAIYTWRRERNLAGHTP